MAGILVENNDVGFQVANSIHNDIEYENLFATTLRGRGGQRISAGFSRSSQFGVKTTNQVKRIGCTNLKTLIESNTLIIEDFNIIAELSSFVAKGKSWEAEAGHHDDLVMCLVLFGWLTTQQYWKDITQIDMRTMMFEDKMKNIEADLTPFGIIDDGLKDEIFIDSEGDAWSLVQDEDDKVTSYSEQMVPPAAFWN